MDMEPADIAAILPFESRYELRRRRWMDGPHASWDAFDRVLGREVVVNVAYCSGHAARFIDQARTIAHLRHPNIYPVLDLGVTREALPYYTEPLIDCESLDSLVRRHEGDGRDPVSPLPLRSLVGIVRDACRALDYASRRGCCHDDLTPGSILIGTEFREVFVLGDWRRQRDDAGGGSGAVDRDSDMVMGCLGYVSPEQLKFVPSFDGYANDVFRLGGILFFVLYGTPPNHKPGGGGDTLRALVGGEFEPRRPGKLRTGIHPGEVRGRSSLQSLERICLRALDGDPGRRQHGAGDLLRDLDGWLGEQ